METEEQKQILKIKNNLIRGDMAKIARELNISRRAVFVALNGNITSDSKAIIERAMQVAEENNKFRFKLKKVSGL